MQHFNFDHLHIIRDETKDQKLLQRISLCYTVYYK